MIHQTLDIRGEGSQENAKAVLYILDDTPEIAIHARPVVVICPGGGYSCTSDREAEMVALQFCAVGYHAAVLRYSVAPARFPAALLEVGKLVLTLKQRREEWHIDPNHIIVMGFSAGGHLAASYGTMWHEPWAAQALHCAPQELRPGAMILCYPVITAGEGMHERSFKNLLGGQFDAQKDALSLESRVNSQTPRTFLWHTWADESVSILNSLKFVDALVRHNIPSEFHMFQRGGHGLSLANRLTQSVNGFGIEAPAACWIDLVHTWIEGYTASAK